MDGLFGAQNQQPGLQANQQQVAQPNPQGQAPQPLVGQQGHHPVSSISEFVTQYHVELKDSKLVVDEASVIQDLKDACKDLDCSYLNLSEYACLKMCANGVPMTSHQQELKNFIFTNYTATKIFEILVPEPSNV